MQSIYEAILEAVCAGRPAALATVIRARGSVPRHKTRKLLVLAEIILLRRGGTGRPMSST